MRVRGEGMGEERASQPTYPVEEVEQGPQLGGVVLQRRAREQVAVLVPG